LYLFKTNTKTKINLTNYLLGNIIIVPESKK